jgi:hypothetical protein
LSWGAFDRSRGKKRGGDHSLAKPKTSRHKRAIIPQIATINHEGIPMKFMITWKASPANYKAAVERFLKTGAPAPSGMKTIGRWHTAGSGRGFHLVEGSDAALAELNAEWADLLDLEVVPVVEDGVASEIATKLYGKK